MSGVTGCWRRATVVRPQLRMRLVWFGGTCFRMSETRGSAPLRCIRRSKQWSRAKLCLSASCLDFPIKEERSRHLWRSDRGNLVATSCQPEVRGQRPEIRPTDHGEQVLPIANLGILREFTVDEASDLQEY